jgi:hypothetical protein
MGIHLKACPSCGRHARISESACPFCGSSLPESFHVPPPFGRPAGRLRRAALISFGAAAGAAGLLEACNVNMATEYGLAYDSDDAGRDFEEGGGFFANVDQAAPPLAEADAGIDASADAPDEGEAGPDR